MPEPWYTDEQITLWHGDALDVSRGLASGSVDCIVTSPPYFGLRDYGVDGQYGLEESPQAYVETMRRLFAELRRVLADDGTLWLNIGDSYGGGGIARPTGKWPDRHDPDDRTNGRRRSFDMAKQMLGIPWRTAFALQDDGWILRNAIIWSKPNAMPESVTDRLYNRYEHIFLFSKQQRYWFDLDPIREPHITADRTIPLRDYSQRPGQWAAGSGGNHRSSGPEGVGRNDGGRNPGDVWELTTKPCPEAHFAVFPPQLPQRCIAAGCKPGGVVLDPFNGIGTTGHAAQQLGRRYIGIDLNADYLELALKTRLRQQTLDFGA